MVPVCYENAACAPANRWLGQSHRRRGSINVAILSVLIPLTFQLQHYQV